MQFTCKVLSKLIPFKTFQSFKSVKFLCQFSISYIVLKFCLSWAAVQTMTSGPHVSRFFSCKKDFLQFILNSACGLLLYKLYWFLYRYIQNEWKLIKLIRLRSAYEIIMHMHKQRHAGEYKFHIVYNVLQIRVQI